MNFVFPLKLKALKLILPVLVMAGGGIGVLGPQEIPAFEKNNLKVRGEVLAVNVKDIPHVIVLRTTTAKHQELIVGATVDPEVEITRGTRSILLHSIQVGEFVNLVYAKTLEGLVAQSINVR